MKKFIKDLILFACISLVSYIVLVCLWGEFVPDVFQKNLKYKKGSYGHLYTRTNEAKNIRDVEVLFLGSSHAYRGFDPRIFESEGYSSFNLGSSAQAHTVANGLLRRYLHSLNPELVIYEVWPKTFMNDGIESTLDVIANDSIDFITLELVTQSRSLLSFNALIFGLYTDMLRNGRSFRESRIRKGNYGTDTYIEGGFVEKTHYALREPDIKVLTEWQKEQFEAFEENLDLIRKSGASVVLIKAPVRQVTYDSLYEMEWFNDKMREYGKYYNYTRRLKLADEYFYDEGHLNQHGVEIFNKQLIRDLQADQILH